MSPGDVLLLVHPSARRLVRSAASPGESGPGASPAWPRGGARPRRGVPCPGLYPPHHAHVVRAVPGLSHHAQVDGVWQLTRVCAQVHIQPVLTVRILQQVRHLHRNGNISSQSSWLIQSLREKWLALYYVETSYCNLCGNSNGNNYTRYRLLQVRLQRPPG